MLQFHPAVYCAGGNLFTKLFKQYSVCDTCQGNYRIIIIIIVTTVAIAKVRDDKSKTKQKSEIFQYIYLYGQVGA